MFPYETLMSFLMKLLMFPYETNNNQLLLVMFFTLIYEYI